MERAPTKKGKVTPTAEECYQRAFTLLRTLSTASSMLGPSAAAQAAHAAGGGHRRGLTTGVLPSMTALRSRASSDAEKTRDTIPSSPQPIGHSSADDVLTPSSPNTVNGPPSHRSGSGNTRRQPLKPGMSTASIPTTMTTTDRPSPTPTPALRTSQSRPAEPDEAAKLLAAEEKEEKEMEERLAREAADADAAYARHASGLMDQVIEQLEQAVYIGGPEYVTKVSSLLSKERLSAKIKNWQGLPPSVDDRHHTAAAAAPLTARDADTEASAGVVPGALALAARQPHWSLKLTALMLCAYYGNHKQCDALLSLDKQVDLQDASEGMTALMFAAVSGHLECFKLLRSSGASFAMTNKQGHDVLRVAVLAQQAKIVKLMFEIRFNPTEQKAMERPFDGRSPLHIAVAHGYIGVVRALCKYIPLEDRTPLPEGATPLMIAVRAGHLVVARELLLHSADPQACTGAASTFTAATSVDGHGHGGGQSLTAPSVTQPPVTPGGSTGDGNTSLHIAASLGYVVGIRLLWAWGGDLSIRNAAGRTPAEVAAAHGRTRATQQANYLAGLARPRDPGMVSLDELAPLPQLLPKHESKKLYSSPTPSMSLGAPNQSTPKLTLLPPAAPSPSATLPPPSPLPPANLMIDVPPGNATNATTTTSGAPSASTMTKSVDEGNATPRIPTLPVVPTETTIATVVTPRLGTASTILPSTMDSKPVPSTPSVSTIRPSTPSRVDSVIVPSTPSTILDPTHQNEEEKRPSTNASIAGHERSIIRKSDDATPSNPSLSPRTAVVTLQRGNAVPAESTSTIVTDSPRKLSISDRPSSASRLRPPATPTTIVLDSNSALSAIPSPTSSSSTINRIGSSSGMLTIGGEVSTPTMAVGSSGEQKQRHSIVLITSSDLPPSPAARGVHVPTNDQQQQQEILVREYASYSEPRFEKPNGDDWKQQSRHEPYWAPVLRDHSIQTSEWSAMRDLITPLLKDMINRQSRDSIGQQAMFALVGQPFVERYYPGARWAPQLLEPPHMAPRQAAELLQKLQAETMTYILGRLPDLVNSTTYSNFGHAMINAWADLIASAATNRTIAISPLPSKNTITLHSPSRVPMGNDQPLPASPAAALIDLCQSNPTARARLKALSGCALPLQLRTYVWNLTLMDTSVPMPPSGNCTFALIRRNLLITLLYLTVPPILE
jgi:ankyrin repeat protein